MTIRQLAARISEINAALTPLVSGFVQDGVKMRGEEKLIAETMEKIARLLKDMTR